MTMSAGMHPTRSPAKGPTDRSIPFEHHRYALTVPQDTQCSNP